MAIQYLDEEQPTSQAQGGLTYLEPDVPMDKPTIRKGRDLRDEITRQLGRTVRVGTEALTGVGGAVADFGYGAAGVASNLAGKPNPLGPRSPTQAQGDALTKMGVPENQGIFEEITGALGSAVGGGVEPITRALQKSVAKMVPQGFKPTGATARVTDELHEAGFKLEPEEGIMNAAKGVAGEANVRRGLQVDNQKLVTQIAAKDIGLRPEDLTAEGLRKSAGEIIQQGYNPIKKLPNITVGRLWRHDLDKIQKEFIPESFNKDVKSEMLDDLNNLRSIRPGNQGFNTEDALSQIRIFREKANMKFHEGDTNYGKGLRKMADAIEDQVDRNVQTQAPEMLDNYRAARRMLAKNFSVREMLVDQNTGGIDTTAAHRMLERGDKLDGGLLLLAKAGAPKYASATKYPTHGESPPLSTGLAYGGAGIGGVLAAPYTGGLSLLAPAGLAAARYGAKKGIMSDMGQNYMFGGGGGQPGPISQAAQRMGIGSAGLFGQEADQMFPTFSQ